MTISSAIRNILILPSSHLPAFATPFFLSSGPANVSLLPTIDLSSGCLLLLASYVAYTTPGIIKDAASPVSLKCSDGQRSQAGSWQSNADS